MQEFFELGLVNMIIEEYEKIFIELLNYVDFIQGEKVNIQIFVSGLPTFYMDRIIYDEPHSLKECIQMAKFMYEQGKNRKDFHKKWKDKLKDKQDLRNKGFKSHEDKQSLYNPFKQLTMQSEVRKTGSTGQKKPL